MMRDLDNDRVLPAEETPAILNAKVKRFRQVLQSEGIEVVRNDDRFLLAFLRARKFEIFRAAALAVSFMKCFNESLEELKKCRMEYVKPFAEQRVTNPQLGKARDGSLLDVVVIRNLDVERFSATDHMVMHWYKILTCFESENMQRYGVSLIQTAEGLTLRRALGMRKVMNSKERQHLFHVLQDVAPIKLKGIYVVNQPWYLSLLYAIAKPFLKKKVRNRIHFLGNPLKLRKFVSLPSLPQSLGGAAEEGEYDWVTTREFMEVKGWHPFFARIPLGSSYRRKLGIPDDVYIPPDQDSVVSEQDALRALQPQRKPSKKKKKRIARRRRHSGPMCGGDGSSHSGTEGSSDAEDSGAIRRASRMEDRGAGLTVVDSLPAYQASGKGRRCQSAVDQSLSTWSEFHDRCGPGAEQWRATLAQTGAIPVAFGSSVI